MATLAAFDLGPVSHALGLPIHKVTAVVELLDAGNTVPFITRYRKDQTGGLDEEQIRQVQSTVLRLRLLADRKQTILRSIDGQGKLTPELAAAIEAADTTKRLEDLYLPFKPKKQTLATTARDRGLEPLALEILQADPLCNDLDARARDFVNTDKHVASAADALLGAGHILAEMFSERADLRGRLRAILEKTGRLVSTGQEPEEKPAAASAQQPAPAVQRTLPLDAGEQAAEVAPAVETSPTESVAAETVVAETAEARPTPTEQPTSTEASSVAAESAVVEPIPTAAVSKPDSTSGESAQPIAEMPPAAPAEEPSAAEVLSNAETPATDSAPAEPATAPTEATVPTEGTAPSEAAAVAQPTTEVKAPGNAKGKKKKKEKEKKESNDHKAFRDYFQYGEALGKIPPHRILAINRGERAKALRVKIEADQALMLPIIDELLVPPGHPHADFLRGCGRDALARLVLPSLEREFRRELTDRAEMHAVEVFARNLRNLLLQPPIRERRVLAIDPGFKSGCKLAALDEFGQLLDHGIIHLVGSEERRNQAKAKLLEMIRQHQSTVIAIGNGTACRETEQFISDMISGELGEQGVAYVIVNEAGASVYSTSRIGREEFPQYDATLRGAISIGRRLQDPLSEWVKIDPANLGVGMYQHDVKAKHLKESLDAVVESCVNYVGVNLNSASPALLRYVSGLNQLTAQRVFDHRQTNGPFKSREELLKVSGFGDATFVQSAGFLKIVGGDNPLDATWIHPESYDAARKVLEKLECTPADLTDKEKAAQLTDRTSTIQLDQLAGEVQVGSLTLSDIVAQLVRPGRDPRESLPPPIFKRGILKLDDLTPAMELAGTVLNVVDFGAFVDIGLKDSGLVHISQLANKYVQDPHSVVSVGDIVKVWVLEVDKQRRRVSLTMIEPGTRRPPEQRHTSRRHDKGRSGAPAPQAAQDGQPQTEGIAAGQQQQQRPPRPQQQRSQQQRSQQRPQQGSQQRPPQRGGRPSGGNRPQQQTPAQPPRPKPKPKPVVPLTKAMKEGKAPLRTFGDLAQFIQLKQAAPPAEEKPAEAPAQE